MDWLAEGIPILQQILVETHDAPDEALGLFDTLETAGYLRYHKEANLLVTEKFRAYNQCIEYGMVKVITSFYHNIHFQLLCLAFYWLNVNSTLNPRQIRCPQIL